jgi:CubicO group peptidase (beta-lactamase class C family)
LPFDAAPGTRYSYSNLGYATLGRIITNLSGKPYQQYIAETQWRPLGMATTTFDMASVPDGRAARGYRWADGRWQPEPVMADGEFGAMGGMATSVNDYARWVGHLLSGWPAPADAAADKPARRLVRSMREGGGFPHVRRRPGRDETACAVTHMVYAAGLVAGQDCVLGAVAFHSGGYPGYGSHMLMLPEAGIGIYAFANRTYAAPTGPVWEAATLLRRAGLADDRPVPVSAAVASAAAAVARIWEAGRIEAVPDALAVNMLMDRPADAWDAELASLKREAGACETGTPVVATSAMAARFQWRCATGRIAGSFLLAPTGRVEIQELFFRRVGP